MVEDSADAKGVAPPPSWSPTDVEDWVEKLAASISGTIISATSEVLPTDEAIINQSVEHVKFSIGGRPVKDNEPAQILVLSMSNSELVFLYACEEIDGVVRFVHGVRPMFSGVGLQNQQGLHLAHDPESRALAVAPAAWWGLRYALIFLGELLFAKDGRLDLDSVWAVEKRFRVTEVFLAVLWVRDIPRQREMG